jgi:hypothetical protein
MKKLETVLSHLFTAEERAEIRQRAKEKLAGLQLDSRSSEQGRENGASISAQT